MNEEGYESATEGMPILTKQFLDTLRVTGAKLLVHLDKIKKGGDDLEAQSKILALSIEGLWTSAIASIESAVAGMATSLADFFTDRDEIYAYSEALKHLAEGTDEYAKAQKKLKELLNDGGSGTYSPDRTSPIAGMGSIDELNKYKDTLTKSLNVYKELLNTATNSGNTDWISKLSDNLTDIEKTIDAVNKKILSYNKESGEFTPQKTKAQIEEELKLQEELHKKKVADDEAEGELALMYFKEQKKLQEDKLKLQEKELKAAMKVIAQHKKAVADALPTSPDAAGIMKQFEYQFALNLHKPFKESK
jgi:hypothetical protein